MEPTAAVRGASAVNGDRDGSCFSGNIAVADRASVVCALFALHVTVSY